MDISVADWDALFDAVRERLCLGVAEPSAQTLALPEEQRAAAHRVLVLECVEALGQLHTALQAGRVSARTATGAPPVSRLRGSFFSGLTPSR